MSNKRKPRYQSLTARLSSGERWSDTGRNTRIHNIWCFPQAPSQHSRSVIANLTETQGSCSIKSRLRPRPLTTWWVGLPSAIDHTGLLSTGLTTRKRGKLWEKFMHGKWTKENFEKHHAENPHIYRMFCHYALKATEVRKYYSAKSVFHRVRWETQIVEKNSDYKIDDGWISHYARKFMDDYPEHAGFFETRVRRESYHKKRSELRRDLFQ